MSKTKKNINRKEIRRKRWKYAGYAALAAGFILILFLFIIFMGGFGHLPSRKELKEVRNYTASEVYSTDNYLLGRYYLENRTNSSIDDIPEFFLQALIATEDARFYKHHGIDTRSTLRVLFKSVLLNRDTGGGSTLTQQLAKNLYPRKDLGILTIPVAKFREMIIARRLEDVYTKSEILQLYLNTVPFGDNTYGIETASLVFFNKKPADLKMEEAAVLVGMLKGNTDYNPMRNYEASLKRRNIVFTQMVKYGYLEPTVADSLKKLDIKLQYRKLRHDEGPAPYLRGYIAQILKKWTEDHPKSDGTKYNIYTDGLKIYTTVDYNLQQYAETAVKQQMKLLQREFDRHWKGAEPWKKNAMIAEKEIKASQRYKKLAARGLTEEEILAEMRKPVSMEIFSWEGEKKTTLSPLDSILYHFALLQAGLLSVESKTGFVKAWVGGIDYKYFKYDHVTSRRQAGSTFKPFVYAAALKKGTSPCKYFANDSVVYEEYDNWTPRNSDREYGGYYSMQGALTHSINTVSAKIMMETGIERVADFSRELGFKGDIPEVPSLALGTGTVSLFELVRAYSIFLNKGHRVEPIIIRRIEDQKGNVIYSQGPEISETQFVSEENAETMIAMLSNVVNRGTASSLRSVYGFENDIAGKTGTTQNQTDGWFVGLTPDLITAVWVGGDNPLVRFRSITYGQGAYMALPIFARYLQKVYKDPVFRASERSRFYIPPDIQLSLMCPDYKDEEYDSIMDLLEKTEETIGDFIRKIFSRKRNRQHEEEEYNQE